VAERSRSEQETARDEIDSLTGGPGVVATKSQAQGSLMWIIIGLVIGAVVGAVVGLIAGAFLVSVLVGAVGGAVVAAVAGGGQRPKQRLESGEVDG
jgi:NADH:ubiquinone oxidoreductase subunit 6 (subunit J)